MTGPSRTIVAAVLTGLTIGVPCTAWYVAGRETVTRERERLVNVAQLGAENVALGLAERIGGRLETLRVTESRRPSYHYVPEYHDPASDCACASMTPSPLSEGPVDPLVWVHIQVDADGLLSLPSLPHEDASTGVEGVRRLEQRAIFARLLGAVDAFADCAVHGRPGRAPAAAMRAVVAGGSSMVLDPLVWETLEIDGRPMLAAVRHVIESGRIVHQGFVVSTESVNHLLAGAYYPATFEPSTEDCHVAIPVAVTGAEWHVAVDAEDAFADARRAGDETAHKFRRTFAGVSGAALLAGIAVVTLIWQTDRLSRARSRFAASAAHELRTPLAGLRVYGEMLAEGLGDPSRAATYARHISSEAERLGRVVSNVLGFSQLERGELSIRPDACDVGREVSACIERLRPSIETAGATIEACIEAQLPPAHVDADALFRVLQNLVDNAEKHTRHSRDRRIHVHVGGEPDAIVITVRDHGSGVSAELRGRVFRAFERRTDVNAPPGLGLGLTLVASLVRAHGGCVTYADAEGGGAAFTVCFPIA